ncbi:DUF2695 domain-containing protein [Amycolatopsis granulosa]|uniref:DUF2695 domain-containing protein n=1 Tax=Amycolatopsis granulosa TaxID=185684 RepID=UPI00142117A7|nr:hypothetical protein [Amycolatopsis granulosa]
MPADAALLDLWTEPQERECLLCYVTRMRADFGCDGTLRWTRRWRTGRAPAVTSLDRIFRRHRTTCDCGVPSAFGAGPVRHGDAGATLPPPCSGVRRGSARPCPAWQRPPPRHAPDGKRASATGSGPATPRPRRRA